MEQGEVEDNQDRRLFSASVARNRDAIRQVFLANMPTSGHLLEIGSGSGEHAVHIAPSVPDTRWIPSDPRPECRASIEAWTSANDISNIAPPLDLDVTESDWPNRLTENVAAALSINMVHIAPFEAAAGLIEGCGALLESGGRLLLYGPFKRHGEHTAPSNLDFDRWLKGQDPGWGVRDLEGELLPMARSANLSLVEAIEMPANNFTVLFERS